MDTLPIPHPESNEILKQQAILNTHLRVGELISAAAEGAGDVVPIRSEHVRHSYQAHDYSDAPRFRNGMGAEVRDVDAFNATDRQEVTTPDGGRVVAERTHHVVGNTYPLDISKSFTRFDPSGELKDVVKIRLGWNGDHYDPKIMISKPGEETRELTGDEELFVKTQIANAFGLLYDLQPKPLSQREDAVFAVTPEAKELVDKLAAELMVEGLSGNKLRTAILKELHPDATSGVPELEEAFKYANSLDYTNTFKVMRHRNTKANSDNQASAKAA